MAEAKSAETLLIDAIDRVDMEKIKSLIEHSGSCVNEASDSSHTPLSAAVLQGNIDIVRILLEHGASCDTTYFVEGGNVLHYSVEHGLEDIANELIRSNVNTNEKNRMGLTALMIAAQSGNLRMI